MMKLFISWETNTSIQSFDNRWNITDSKRNFRAFRSSIKSYLAKFFTVFFLCLLLEIFCNSHSLTKRVFSWNQVRDDIGHSVDGCRTNSNCMRWSVIQILLNYLIGFEKVRKQIMMWFKQKLWPTLILLHGQMNL